MRLATSAIFLRQVDVWAAGCVLYELLFNKHPFRKANIITDNWAVPKGRSQKEPLVNILCQCLEVILGKGAAEQRAYVTSVCAFCRSDVSVLATRELIAILFVGLTS